MTALTRSLKSITASALFKIRKLLIGLMFIGVGILLGYLHSSSRETAELTISIVVVFIMLLVIMDKPLNGLLVLFVLEPFLEQYVMIPLGAGIPNLSFSRFTVAFLVVFMLAQAAIGKFRFATPISLAEICIIATTAGIMSVAPLHDDPKRVIQLTITRFFMPLTMYFFARQLVRNEKDLNKLLSVIVIFGFAASVYAIYESSTGHILFVKRGTEASELTTTYTEHLYRIRGLLGNPGQFARVLTSSIPVTFYLLFEHKSVRRKILLAGVLVIQFYALFLTYNRTCWYALMIGLFILQFFYPQFRKVYLVLVVVAAIVLWATWAEVSQSAVAEERVDRTADSFEGRSNRWRAAFSMWQVKPIRGWGVDAYEKEAWRFRTDGSREKGIGTENDYLYIMVASGLIGFLPYLVFLLAPLLDSLRLFFRARAPDWSGFIKPGTITIYWCVMITFAINSYTQVQNCSIVRMIPYAVAGAVVGTHQHCLRGLQTRKRSALELHPATTTAERS